MIRTYYKSTCDISASTRGDRELDLRFAWFVAAHAVVAVDVVRHLRQNQSIAHICYDK